MTMRLVTTIFVISVALIFYWIMRDMHWFMVPALFAGWYVADLLSGLVHMFMDYHACPSGRGLDRLYFYEGSRTSREYQAMFKQTMAGINPVQRLVYDFKNHHPRPDALGRRNTMRQIGSTIVVGSLPASLLFNLVCIAWVVPSWIATGFLATLVGGTFAQYFHGTLHRKKNPFLIRGMRKIGLLMTPEQHQRHHATLRRDFSTNCGWSNPIVNLIFNAAYRKGLLRDEGLEPTG